MGSTDLQQKFSSIVAIAASAFSDECKREAPRLSKAIQLIEQASQAMEVTLQSLLLTPKGKATPERTILSANLASTEFHEVKKTYMCCHCAVPTVDTPYMAAIAFVQSLGCEVSAWRDHMTLVK